jgi:hypothetical protein
MTIVWPRGGGEVQARGESRDREASGELSVLTIVA